MSFHPPSLDESEIICIQALTSQRLGSDQELCFPSSLIEEWCLCGGGSGGQVLSQSASLAHFPDLSYCWRAVIRIQAHVVVSNFLEHGRICPTT